MRRALTFDDILPYFDERAVYDENAQVIAPALRVIASRSDSAKFLEAVNVKCRARELSNTLIYNNGGINSDELDQTVLGYATHCACHCLVRSLYSAASSRVSQTDKACFFKGIDHVARELML